MPFCNADMRANTLKSNLLVQQFPKFSKPLSLESQPHSLQSLCSTKGRNSVRCRWGKRSEYIVIGPHHQLQLLLNSRQLRAHDLRTDPVRDTQCHEVVRSDRRVTEIGGVEACKNFGAGTMESNLRESCLGE